MTTSVVVSPDSDVAMEGEDPSQDQADGKNDDAVDDFKEFQKAIPQIENEYQLALKFMRPKWQAWLTRLRLYNNQKRRAEYIGDPLLFTIFQTVLASLYSDELTVEFVGRNHGSDEQAENLNIMAKYDTAEMDKETLDYDWIWDTCFFGRGLVMLYSWDDEAKCPIPENIDPLSFLRDPEATSVNGDRQGHGALNFCGREIRLTERQLEEAGVYKNIDALGENDDGVKSEIDKNKQVRREALGYDQLRQQLTGDNKSHILLEWFTYFDGKKYCFTLGKNRTQILRVQEIKTRQWPMVDRTLFRTAHEWDGVSIPDLVEDKQRARSIIMNLAKKGVQAKLYPNYLYNNQIITNKSDLAKMEFNKFIGVKGQVNNVIAAIPREGITTDVQWMLDLMDGNSQKATATPDIQQGAMTNKVRSATEMAKVAQGVDTRYALSTKQFGWSEKKFWKLWYESYYIYFSKDVYNKIIRLSGAMGPQYREIQRANIISEEDPDIFIESKVISDAKRMNKLNMWMAFMNQAVAMDKDANRRFFLREQGKAMGVTTDELNRALPKTFDEFEAEQENILLADGKLPKISNKQNHQVHIEIHSKAVDNHAKAVHIQMHTLALYHQREMPMLQPEPQIDPTTGQPIQTSANGQQPSPMEQGKTPAPRDMAQSALQLQAPNAVQQAQ